ncbi:hypothetical protein [Methylobacterium sp. JK268]
MRRRRGWAAKVLIAWFGMMAATAAVNRMNADAGERGLAAAPAAAPVPGEAGPSRKRSRSSHPRGDAGR